MTTGRCATRPTARTADCAPPLLCGLGRCELCGISNPCPLGELVDRQLQREAFVDVDSGGARRQFAGVRAGIGFQRHDGSSALQQIEFKGAHVLRELTGALFGNYLDATAKPKVLLAPDVHRVVTATDGESARARLLCDHLAGMTDAYALRSYKRLFDPDYGSISELI